MLTLYHAPMSRSSRILWLLEEIGADYDIVYCNIPRRDGTGAADPANPHPDRKVPALVHDGALVTESVAIILYLTDLFPKAALAPHAGDPLRGAYLTWLAYYAGVIEPVVHFQVFGLADHEGLARSFRGRAEIDRRIGAALGRSPYLLGDDFTAADLLIASIGQWQRDLLPAGEPVDDWLARCTSRPALARAGEKDAPPA